MVETCAQKVSPIMKGIKQHLISSEVVNFDETGVRALGSLYWVHNASNSEFTYQSIDKKRGLEGIKTNHLQHFLGCRQALRLKACQPYLLNYYFNIFYECIYFFLLQLGYKVTKKKRGSKGAVSWHYTITTFKEIICYMLMK